MAPGQRESAGKKKELHIERSGSKMLRWVLVEAAWQLVRRTGCWRVPFERLGARIGRKKAIVAMARRLLGVMMALLKDVATAATNEPDDHGDCDFFPFWSAHNEAGNFVFS